jgi:dTDP-glucose pyrophosphorylase
MWGIIPAAGRGSRIQPLAFSKELLPVGSRRDGASDRPLAISEYLVDRMLLAGVDKLCFVISPGKSDILEYYGGRVNTTQICYAVQDSPRGLCDSLFRALPFIADDERVCVGLPDTLWFPREGFLSLADAPLGFLLFPVANPALFDAVVTDQAGDVLEIEVKVPAPKSHWVWGAFATTGKIMRDLFALWQQPGRGDEYLGTLVNAYLAAGGHARGFRTGRAYVDVGTLHGFREALRLLEAVKLLSDVDMLGQDPRAIVEECVP